MANTDVLRLLTDDAHKHRKQYEQDRIDQFKGYLIGVLGQSTADALELTFVIDPNTDTPYASFQLHGVICQLIGTGEGEKTISLSMRNESVGSQGNVFEPGGGLSIGDQLLLFLDTSASK